MCARSVPLNFNPFFSISDQHIEDLLDQIEDVELRLLKVETLYNGLKSADSHYHREI